MMMRIIITKDYSLLLQTLHGIGSTPLWSIGTAYVDENVSQTASPLYLGESRNLQSFNHSFISFCQ